MRGQYGHREQFSRRKNFASVALEERRSRPILGIAQAAFVDTHWRMLRVSTLIIHGTGQPD